MLMKMYCTQLHNPSKINSIFTPLPICTSPQSLVSIGQYMTILNGVKNGWTNKIYRILYRDHLVLYIGRVHDNAKFIELFVIYFSLVPNFFITK